MRLLLTRPTPEAERTASALRARGHDVLFAPMLEIENIRDASFGGGPWSAVLMTSGNAARALAENPRRNEIVTLRCFSVGRQTAEAARLAGFGEVISADGDGGELAQLVAREIAGKSLPLLYLAGDDRARDMAAEIAPAGLRLETEVVYRAVAAKGFEPGHIHQRREVFRVVAANIQVFQGHAAQRGKIDRADSTNVQYPERHPAQGNEVGSGIVK